MSRQMIMRTIQQAYDWLISRFGEVPDLYYGHGTDNLNDEAWCSLCFILGKSPEQGFTDQIWQQLLTEQQWQGLLKLVYRRVKLREPLAYITEQAWFMGLPFYVNKHVLIPRSPFAEWIEHQFKPWVDPEHVQRVCEIGTGSGCIAIATALALPQVKLDAIDISPQALSVAQRNLDTYQLNDRVRLIESDCYQALASQRYDIILSNPPYVSDAEMLELPAEYRHEPTQALRADDHGLAIVTKLIEGASQHLTATGVLLVEVGYSDEALIERYPHVPFTWLEQAYGGHGILLLTQPQCEQIALG